MKPEYIVTEIRNLLGIDIGIDVSEYEDRTAVCFYKKDAEVVIAAIEKQIPKKPKISDGIVYERYEYCPSCGISVTDNYCGNCGQRIDWGNEE